MGRAKTGTEKVFLTLPLFICKKNLPFSSCRKSGPVNTEYGHFHTLMTQMNALLLILFLQQWA